MDKTANMYERYQKLIMSRAWAWAERTGVPFDEIMAEGTLVFMKCMTAYDDEKGPFSTYLYTSLENGLRELCFNAMERSATECVNIEDLSESLSCHDPIMERAALKEAIHRMSEEAKSVVMLVLYSPSELVPFAKTSGTLGMRTALKRYLSHLGWNKRHVHSVFREIKRSLVAL